VQAIDDAAQQQIEKQIKDLQKQVVVELESLQAQQKQLDSLHPHKASGAAQDGLCGQVEQQVSDLVKLVSAEVEALTRCDPAPASAQTHMTPLDAATAPAQSDAAPMQAVTYFGGASQPTNGSGFTY